MENQTPKALGYFFPAEWHPHRATWLSYPHNETSFPERMHEIQAPFFTFIKLLSQGEKVYLNIGKMELENYITQQLQQYTIDPAQVILMPHPTNDAWCRDHGPAFLINQNPNLQQPKAIVNWNYNAWGNKYPFELDDKIPSLVAKYLGLPIFSPNIVMEGGAVDFNGKGTVLTTEACLLHPNRNPHLNKSQIETFLQDYYGVEQVLWLKDGIVGDDTNGHIDDITRFVAEDTVITMVEPDKTDENHAILQENLALLKTFRLPNQKPLKIVEIPMPKPVIWKGERLPASYANFYIGNQTVVVPTFQCENDQKAIDILQQYFPQRKVVGVDATALVWGLGTFHCLSQQEPV